MDEKTLKTDVENANFDENVQKALEDEEIRALLKTKYDEITEQIFAGLEKPLKEIIKRLPKIKSEVKRC